MPNPVAAANGGEKDKALASVMAQIEKQHGKGAVMRLGDDVRPPIEVIPTGSIALDVALGIGGLPRGRVVEIYGPESSGKTTVALHAVANAQKAGGIAAFIDAEHALDPEYAKALGVDTDALLVSQPDTGEQALEIADMLIRSGALDIIVIDSVAALVPRAEIEGEMGDSHVGLQARLMSQALRKITGALSTTGTTAIFINQLREKIGVMFGSPETTTGGKALKFYASVRLDVRRIETLKDGTDAVGNRTRCKVVKNKVSPPFKQAEFDIIYGQGISREGGLIDMGVEQGFVRKAGAWYTMDGDQLGQGKENARTFLKDNPDLADELEKNIKDKLGIGVPRVDALAAVPPPDPEADPRTRGSEPDPHDWARQIVLRQLTAAPRSRAQLEQALRKKDCPDEIAAAVLDRMEEVGLVDDTAYAGMLVRSQQAGRGLARRALAQELRRKGVDDETAQAALDDVDPHDEEDRARALVAKKMRSMSGLDPLVQTRRLAGMLARKGYPSDLTMRIVREAVREAPEHQRD
jgi:recombination protein RecA